MYTENTRQATITFTVAEIATIQAALATLAEKNLIDQLMYNQINDKIERSLTWTK